MLCYIDTTFIGVRVDEAYATPETLSWAAGVIKKSFPNLQLFKTQLKVLCDSK